jgi:transcriptional regulator
VVDAKVEVEQLRRVSHSTAVQEAVLSGVVDETKQRDIASSLGLTDARISQIRKEVLARLREAGGCR